MDTFTFQVVTAANVAETGICCVKDVKSPAYRAKIDWFMDKQNKGLQIIAALDQAGKQIGFIEFLPSELAWRPVKASNYYFIHCIAVYKKEAREKGLGSALLQQCEKSAREAGKSGLCSMCSDGPWMATRSLFEKNGFESVEKLGRYELIVKAFDIAAELPGFIDWQQQQAKYKGWHLLYADQCPWHENAVIALKQTAIDKNIELKITKLHTPLEARQAPSGFGTFSLIHDGKLLADHYISKTRFMNILQKELT
jgi:L-amino acid N-acyltransferase YncA